MMIELVSYGRRYDGSEGSTPSRLIRVIERRMPTPLLFNFIKNITLLKRMLLMSQTAQFMNLDYFDRFTALNGGILYTAKSKCFFDFEEGSYEEGRFFFARIDKDGRFMIEQHGRGSNELTTLTAEAALELSNIYIDWMKLNNNGN